MFSMQKLPSSVTIVSHQAAPGGWYYYRYNPEKNDVLMLPIVSWVHVEYENPDSGAGSPGTLEELRTFIIMRATGDIVDAAEFDEGEYVGMFGPGVHHGEMVRKVVSAKYPHAETNWKPDATN